SLQAFNISDEEWKKHRLGMISQLIMLDYQKPGFIPHLHRDSYDHSRDSEQLARDLKNDPEGLVGATYTFAISDKRRKTIAIERVLSCAEGTSGRSSVVAQMACVCSANGCLTSGCEWHGESKIMKISSKSSTREPEPDLIFKAKEMATSTGNNWALKHLPNILESITIKYPENSFHQWLYECAGILHRDLSIGNLMFCRKEGKVYGVLNDFDLSSTVDRMAQGPSSKERTGTRPFMSPDLLDSHWKIGHLPRHDLESLFYIILCLVCRYDEL
ncbi:hypothetical protein EV360DRAFT_66714, partial [Lentinula raphanica]